MDDETTARLKALLGKTVAELTVGEAIWLALTIERVKLAKAEAAALDAADLDDAAILALVAE